MSRIGIYFGPTIIKIVELQKNKIKRILDIPQSLFEPSEELSEEKVPLEIKITLAIEEEFKKNRITPHELFFILTGKETIIRTFELPMVPKKELPNIISFEVRKYLPFNLEEIIWDFKAKIDTTTNRYLILFVGMRKEIFESYFSISQQLKSKLSSIEYSGFSLLRFLKLEKKLDKEIIGIVSIEKQDELNFMILKDGYIIFSRDVELPAQIEGEEYLDKLKSELKISLDFYTRKFISANLEKIFLISPLEYKTEIENFLKEKNIRVEYLKSKIFRKPQDFSVCLLKAYAGSLDIRLDLPNLLLAKERLSRIREKKLLLVDKELKIPDLSQIPDISQILTDLRVSPLAVILSLIILGLSFILLFPRKKELQSQIDNLKQLRPKITFIDPQLSSEDIRKKKEEYKHKIDSIEKSIKERILFTKILNIIAQNKLPGLWLERLSLDQKELVLLGMVYLDEPNLEIETINNFLKNIKKEAYFNMYFSRIELESVEKSIYRKKPVTKFVIRCRRKEVEERAKKERFQGYEY